MLRRRMVEAQWGEKWSRSRWVHWCRILLQQKTYRCWPIVLETQKAPPPPYPAGLPKLRRNRRSRGLEIEDRQRRSIDFERRREGGWIAGEKRMARVIGGRLAVAHASVIAGEIVRRPRRVFTPRGGVVGIACELEAADHRLLFHLVTVLSRLRCGKRNDHYQQWVLPEDDQWIDHPNRGEPL
jgi:hypothetical protein